MPLYLDNLSTSAATQVYTPKFFGKELTGSGKKTGLLSEFANPVNRNAKQWGFHGGRENTFGRKSMKNGTTNIKWICVGTVPELLMSYITTIPAPDKHEITRIATNGKQTLFIKMEPYCLQIEESITQGGGTSRKLSVAYRIYTYVSNTGYPTGQCERYSTQVPNSFDVQLTCDPIDTLNSLRRYFPHWTFDQKALDDFIQNYSLYNEVCRMSERWQTAIDKDIEVILDNYKNNLHTAHELPLSVFQKDMIFKMENFSVSLDMYRKIYNLIKAKLPADDAIETCKQNLNLLLSDTLQNLASNKSQIPTFVPQTDPTKMPASLKKFSTEQQRAITSTEPLVLVQAGAGTGKALPLDTPVLTKKGWVRMGDLKVGDKVIGSNGTPCTVLRIHEQGIKPGYCITFCDGSSVECCGEHLWEVRCQSRGKEISRTLTTKEWLNSSYKTHGYLPTVKPVQFDEKKLPLDPYFLGALLANACPTDHSVQYTNSETDVINAVRKAAKHCGFDMYEVTPENSAAKQWQFRHANDTARHNVLKTVLEDLGVMKTAHDKFIPEQYLFGSIEQRTALMNGLFDGNGDTNTLTVRARYHTASEKLADSTRELLWSLGLNAVKQRQKNKNGDGWSVNLLSDTDPFRASHYRGPAHGARHPLRRSIKSVEPIKPVPMRCIEVDALDKLYVTKDFIVTHNSTVILGRIEYMMASGIKPEDITVLSFTNAAADNITAKNPNVHSMTIARMIHSIYETNFPKQELSSTGTLVNCLDIYYPNDILAREFRKLLNNMVHDEKSGYTALNNFVEEHFDEVITLLDTMEQTTLPLEIIICYQKIDQLVEPPNVTSKYLILDEVQDNSIFEFIYTLKYVDKHKESLFIVGKPLQLPTLNLTNCWKLTAA